LGTRIHIGNKDTKLGTGIRIEKWILWYILGIGIQDWELGYVLKYGYFGTHVSSLW